MGLRISGFRPTNIGFGIEDTPFIFSNCVESMHKSVDAAYTYVENSFFFDFQYMYL